MRGNNYKLPPPFFVLATQNPIELEGTYPLPEAQLDRFLFNTVLDYLTADEEMQVVDLTTTTHVAQADPVTNAAGDSGLPATGAHGADRRERGAARGGVGARQPRRDEFAPDFVKKYVNYGASVRAAQFLVLAAKARALMHGRYHVTYEDIRALYIPILRHRMLLNFHAESDTTEAGRHPEEDSGVEAVAEGVGSVFSPPRRGGAEMFEGKRAAGDSGVARANPERRERPDGVLARWITEKIIGAAIEVHRRSGAGADGVCV